MTASTPADTAAAKPADAADQPVPRPPLWSVELLDVLGRRGRFAVVTASILTAFILLVALIAPSLVPPGPLVGAAVAVTALAIGLALALALDTLDVRVRGPRHVRSAGGELVALLPTLPRERDAADLAAAVLAVRPPNGTLHLGIAPIGNDLTTTVAWTRALGEALARSGTSVLLVDIAAGPTSERGILQVVRDRTPLADVVSYAPGDLPMAEAGPGGDHLQALQALVTLPTALPADVDVLLVAMPPIVTRSAVNASRVLDQVLFVAEANLTSRVDLMASLDALRVAGCSPQVILVDDGTFELLRPEEIVTEDRPRPTTPLTPLPLDGPATSLPAAAALAPPVAAVAPVAPVAPAAPAPVPIPVPTPLPASLVAEPTSSPMRAVEVLEEAAREQAETTLEAALIDTVPMSREEVERLTRRRETVQSAPPAVVAPVEAPVVVAPPTVVAPLATPPAPSAPESNAPESQRLVLDPELTTELSRATGPLPSWASEEDEEDLLRTTVQMSAFGDELDLRDEH